MKFQFVCFIVITIFLLQIYSCDSYEPPSESSKPYTLSKSKAYIIAQILIERVLQKTSSSIKFPPFSPDFVVFVSGEEASREYFQVTAHLEGKNSFGEKVRNYFGCEISHLRGKDEGWRFENLTILDDDLVPLFCWEDK